MPTLAIVEAIPMVNPAIAIPKWASVVIRTVGIVNLILVLLGTSFLSDSCHFFLTKYAADASRPYFESAFIAMTLISAAFLVLLLVTSIRFLQVRIASINSYSLLVLVLVGYDYTIGVLWRVGQGVGMSIAAATGVGNMGVAPFEFCFVVPYLYPLASIVLLQVLKRIYGARNILVSAG